MVPTHFTVFAAAVALSGLEKTAAEQDEMMKVAEQELEPVQEAAKETAQVIMGFGGKQQMGLCGVAGVKKCDLWIWRLRMDRLLDQSNLFSTQNAGFV
eukprot:COSAG02_NODE_43533_length_374_cov_0.429091_1_plen_98_part_00